MTICAYFYSYPKTSVSGIVRNAWDRNKPISHIDHVYGEVENDQDKMEWSARTSFCYEALKLITPKDKEGCYHGDEEFSISRETLIAFKANVEQLDQKDAMSEDWVKVTLHELQQLIDTFNFDEKYLTVQTD